MKIKSFAAVFFVWFALLIGGAAFAQETPPLDRPKPAEASSGSKSLFDKKNFLFSAGVEVNGYSREGLAAGITGNALYYILPTIAGGVVVGLSNNFDDLTTIEVGIAGRYYAMQINNMKLFAKAEGGLSVFLENSESKISYFISAGAGLRIPIGKFQIEPYIEGGLPFMYGVGVSFVF